MMRQSILATTLLAALVGCGPSGPSVEDLNKNLPPGGSGTTGGSGGTSVTGGGTGAVVSGGSGGSAGSSITPPGGAAGMTTGGSDMGGATVGGSGGTGGEAPSGPFAPRSGSFKMLVLSRTAGFRHDGSITTGKVMLQEIAAAQGFELAYADTDAEIDAIMTPQGLMPFEIMFHMNTTGDMLDDAQQATYEAWMKNDGAFAGTHSATDTEADWAFYKEVTGQYYNGHGAANTPDQIQFEAAAANFIALKGLPNPWQRNEEWYKFDNHQVWSAKPGFQILGRKAADGQPIIWTRQSEDMKFRAFYTAIGHDGTVFQDPDVKKHLTGGIMWAVRRDHLIK